MARNVLRSMPTNWDTTTSIILQSKDFSTYTMDMLMGSLMTEEIHRKMNEEVDKKRKDIALKVTTSKTKGNDDSSDESEDGDMALITKNFKKYLRSKNGRKDRRFSRKDGNKEETSKRDPIICYECKKPGHIKSECPQVRKYSKKDKKKAMLAAWDNSDDSSSDSDDEKQEIANLCFMAKEESEVYLDPSSLSFDELLDAFKCLQNNFQKVRSKNISLKKFAKDLSKELDDLIEEKNILEEENENLKKMSDVDSLHEQIKELIKEKNLLKEENDDLRKMSNVDSLHEQIHDLTESLSKFTKGKESLDLLLGKQRCSFHKTGIGYNPNQHKNLYKNLFEKNSSSRHSKLTCHYCGKLGHISPACPMKGHSSDYVNKTWVKKNQTYFARANHHGPKMIWVPKIKS